jgi:carbamoyl-phosphate synthase small subunit
MPDHPPRARLILEDGTLFTGRAFGATTARDGQPVTSTGEVVFCTAMTGYQEALSDPSYSGQILTMTAPLIGNYGVNAQDVESTRPQVAGFVVRELARRRSSHRADGDLPDWLADAGILGVDGIDTRALVRRIRQRGAMRGVISNDRSRTDRELSQLARRSPSMSGRNLAAVVSPSSPATWEEDLGEWGEPDERPAPQRGPLVLAIDCGAKRNIYRHLAERGCRVESAPWDVDAAAIVARRPQGLLVSNGPGDPAAVTSAVETLRQVAGVVPTMGICLGHQLLALALGARTYKLKFGHRGTNQPVRNLITGRVEITSQNHGFCVDAASLEAIDCEVTHLHLNDGTVAGFRHRTRPLFSVQYHPEASPGPHDSAYLFDCFLAMVRSGSPLDPDVMRRAQDRRTRRAR